MKGGEAKSKKREIVGTGKVLMIPVPNITEGGVKNTLKESRIVKTLKGMTNKVERKEIKQEEMQ